MTERAGLGFAYEFRPAGAGPAPTLLLLHGAGGDERALLPVGEAVGPGAALLAPRGKLDDDGGARFLHRGDDGTFDPDEVHTLARDLAGFVGGACDSFGLDRSDVWVLGYSNGATAAAALALDHPSLVAGGILLAGRAPYLDPEQVIGPKPFFCAHGRADPVVSIDDYEELVELLVAAGAEVELHWYDRGHEISEQEVRDARDWLVKQLYEPEG
jgi:phospholipase/carboxylesterase